MKIAVEAGCQEVREPGPVLPSEEGRLREAEQETDDMPDPDPEEASICLTCGRARCLLDEDRPCLRYRRGMRALRKRRTGMTRNDGGGNGERPGVGL